LSAPLSHRYAADVQILVALHGLKSHWWAPHAFGWCSQDLSTRALRLFW